MENNIDLIFNNKEQFTPALLFFITSTYATFFIKSKQGHFLQRLLSDFLNFLQHLDLTLPNAAIPEASRTFIRSFLRLLFFFFLPISVSLF
ncbi:hypothetical protein [Winogradskyella endarachnes]|uniref:Uncharacterized protein n=1 Tax=Winogradskyella endarachnes TaxID=2681965 RepID=A0A6L6UC34_9FLAO|nr:hypothetical protein [Winogradskyella endarachnes]MUU78467.1 hypothetical protein [Winogradskyella endarachnes]